MDIKEVAHGIIGLSKAAAEIERADDKIIAYRLNTCNMCPKKIKEFSKIINKDVSKCSICKCYIRAKVLLKNEFCPDDPPRWEKEK